MSFIGIICESKNENYIKQVLTKSLKNEKIVILDKDNIESLKNIIFETIAIFTSNNEILYKKDRVKNFIQKSNYLIINADETMNLEIFQDVNVKVITYGFNSKSTITASSVRDENILLCIQRIIQNLQGKMIEPQEISIQKKNAKMGTNIILGLATIQLLYGNSEIIL